MKKKTVDQLIKDVAQAHTNLNVFASVVSILEGGHLYGAISDEAANRIIAISQREQARCLKRYDEAVAALVSLQEGKTP